MAVLGGVEGLHQLTVLRGNIRLSSAKHIDKLLLLLLLFLSYLEQPNSVQILFFWLVYVCLKEKNVAFRKDDFLI